MSIDSEEIAALVIEITEYFETHPNAADSLEGITKWWLKKSDSFISQKSVLQALDLLCEKGLVVKTVGQTGSIIYSSDPGIKKSSL